jgi:hypothetical protein
VLRFPGLFSTIDEQNVADRGKSDAFTKTFAIAQSSWLVVSSIARIHHGLAITELELATMAFIVCAFVMYIFWWNKPFGAEERCLMIAMELTDDERFLVSHGRVFPDEPPHLPAHRALYQPSELIRYKRVSDLDWRGFMDLVLDNNFTIGLDFKAEPGTVALYISGMAFSAVHVAAWNWQFPSPTVQLLWRVASIGALAASAYPFVLGTVMKVIAGGIEKFEDSIPKRILSFLASVFNDDFFFIVSAFGLGIYVICRLIILYLTFYCFTSMPSSVYEKLDWTGYIPHFS